MKTEAINLMFKIRENNPDVKVKEMHYTANSLIASVVFNNQDYTIEIKPEKKDCNHNNCVMVGHERLCLVCGRSV